MTISPNLSVLILDDDPEIPKLIRSYLRGTKWNLIVTETAREAVRAADSLHPDVILCDAELREYSGADVIQALRSEALTANIPIVLMTGFADVSMFAHLAWNSFLAKPFTAEALQGAIRGALRSAVPPRISTQQDLPANSPANP